MAGYRGSKSGANIAHCDGYAWDLKSLLGKGSYGNVYKGWSNGNKIEVAVKVVRKDLFRQDPKAEQNLKREIDILKKLRACEYVVHLYHVEDMQRSDAIVMVMELCECDLDHLIKVKPFSDQDIILLLHQLGEGMKALRAHNVVHRDIKPGNILIKYHPKTGKMLIKLADFGFARHFTDESMKPLDLTSLAGTPVFMAPEALRCVFNPGVEHYDDKVDIWSIGALLYKVIVGQCGFYAQLNHILHILDKKGDAIAWEPSNAPNYGPVPKVKFIKELPPAVDDRLSPPFKQKMNQLLMSLLKLDPLERMTFPEFFDFTDDLIKSKVEVINLLHGTGFKFMMETGMKPDHLQGDIDLAVGTPPESQIIFCSQSDLFIANKSTLSENDFNLFMNRAGGSQGHALLYLVPVNEITAQLVEPDYGSIAKLMYCVENKAHCVLLITEHKYSDEIVHAIGTLQKQIERQFSCIQEFRSFCTKQLVLLNDSLGDTRQLCQETLAKSALANDWLGADISILDKGTSLDVKAVKEYKGHVDEVKRHKMEIEGLVEDMEGRLQSCDDAIMKAPSLEINDLIENAKTLTKQAKTLTSSRKEFIYQSCEQLLQYCKGLIVSSSERAHKQLKVLYSALSNVWNVMDKLQKITEKRHLLENILTISVPQWRANLLKSTQATPPPQITAYQQQPPTQGWSQLQQELQTRNEKIKRLEDENLVLLQQLKSVPQNVTGSKDTVLVQKLKAFCSSAKRVIDPSSAKAPPSPNSERRMLYPDLDKGGESGGFLITPSTVPSSSESLDDLLPMASLHLEKLQEKLLRNDSGGVVNDGQVIIKITKFELYQPGDIVLFHPLGNPGTSVQLNLLHLTKPKPYGILQPECYADFGFRPGRIADLVIGELLKPPEEAFFKDDQAVAKAIGEIAGSERKFYRIWAKPAGIDFVRKGVRTFSSGGKDGKSDKRSHNPIPTDRKHEFT